MRPVAALVSLALALSACQASPSPSATAGSTPGSTSAASPGAIATGPGRTPVPGFDGWQTVNPQAARISKDGEALVVELVGSVLWFNADRGVLFHTDVEGNFRLTATVRTTRTSDPSKPPGADGSIQLAGLMARTEVPAENYVFIVTGSIGQSDGIETKTTTDSRSIYVQRGRAFEGDADLRMCRVGSEIHLSWRAAASEDDWTPMSTFDRRDMPETLQVGVNIYTDGAPDITARFEGLALEPLEDGVPC